MQPQLSPLVAVAVVAIQKVLTRPVSMHPQHKLA
jgi:hypothetical protein